MHPLDASSRTTILAHYYRAMIGRADVWRTRMDTTTNWAIVSMAAVLSFTLGSADVPHHVVLIAPTMTAVFMMLEARRLTFYHLWQQRALLLEAGLLRPALAEGEAAIGPDLARELEPHLGRTAPVMPLWKAVARRLRRVYLYLFLVQLLAWLLKLADPAGNTATGPFLARARIGAVPGEAVFALAGASVLLAAGTAWALGGPTRKRA